ncbi:MAG: hypothetical protein JWR69_4598 [Pedosphaera sp.]|nr:hypothetical protein [Pedosphaera sp.]
MRHISPVLIAFFLACAAPALHAVDPIPESQQAPLVLKLLDAYHGTRPATPPKKLHLVYFTPSDREPEPRYRERLEAIMEDIRAFYRDGMERAGFGPETFNLARDAEGKLIIHLVKGKETESSYNKPDGEKISRECSPALEAAGISFERETVLIFCNLGTWDEKAGTFSHHSPYYGMSFGGTLSQTSGLCFAVDSAIQNLDDIPKKAPILDDDEYGKMSLGKFNTIFIGGIAHELGHALSLPHCGERWDEKPRGTSLMGAGNHTYREERRDGGRGTFLTMASAMKLAARPLFSKSDRDLALAPRLDTIEFQLSTNVSRRDLAKRHAALRVEGTVKGTPPVCGVIAYFNSPYLNSLHHGEYRAPTATAVPDAEGRFAIEVSDLAPCSNGELRIEYCHVNGAVSESHAPFRVTPERTLDLEQWEVANALHPLSKAVIHGELDAARSELLSIEKSSAPELAKTIARKLVSTLQNEPKPTPVDVPPQVTKLPLGDARPQVAEVGWLKPAANRIPLSEEIESPWLDSGKIYATGLYAHAPSRYVYDLGGKWKKLRGEAGLHTAFQPYGSVVFVIKTDGKEVFRSPSIRESAKASYDVNVTGAKTLELIVEKAEKRNSGNWGLWLDPMLSQEP